MKYPGGNHSTLFCEQVGTVTSLFEQWNDCKRTVVLYALLKRVPFANLKFLQLSIDYNLAQNYSTQTKLNLLENNSNNALFLSKLIQKYQNLNNNNNNTSNNNNNNDEKQQQKMTNDSILYESESTLGKHDRKEDILNDILTYLPLLKPGNDDAKSLYMSLIPTAVDDAVRQIVPTELVQQILSYLLIHPAITNEDRRSLSQWLRHLEDHISSSYIPTAVVTQPSKTNYFILPNNNNNTISQQQLSINNSTIGSSSQYLTSSWHTVAPPSSSSHQAQPLSKSQQNINNNLDTSVTSKIEWDLNTIQMTQDFCDDIKKAKEFSKTIGKNNLTSSQTIICSNNSQSSVSSSSLLTSQSSSNNICVDNVVQSRNSSKAEISDSILYDNNEDHHISFSKNGTEIFDYDDLDNDDDFNFMTSSSGSSGKKLVSFDNNIIDFLRVPYAYNVESDSENGLIKTRRSNSLTTTATSSCLTGGGGLQNQQKQQNECLSAENLTNLQMQKPRSFSLTMESPRSSLTSSGSETRLDDFKQTNMMKLYGQTHNIGMSNIGQWLKSLRLHKYVWLFSNLTYEEMLSMTEEHLSNLGVTKGARHKLVLCIQKLKERYQVLVQLEKELLAGQKGILNNVLEELTNIVLTPMKPIGHTQKEDVAAQFMKVLDLVASIMCIRPICSQQDEESLNIFLWILERALHNDAFMSHTNQLKEHKYKLSKIKMQFAPKSHFSKNPNSNGSINKPKWSSNTKHKPGMLNESLPKPHRKSSVQYFTVAQQQQQQQHQQQYYHHTSSSNNYNKSSSYPSFASSSTNVSTTMNNSTGSVGGNKGQTAHHLPSNIMYHRHSLNNLTQQQSPLSNLTSNPTSAMPLLLSTLPAPSSASTSNSASGNKIIDKKETRCAEQQQPKNDSNKNSIGDINSRLEFLCLQMTEQAIN